ncbi:MAG: GAF domain-containing protein [Prevotella sp.]|nr:GAF domain-containing protein [Prevotella sp.]
MNSTEKNSLYVQLVEQARALVENEPDEIANMANVVALIHNTFHFWWTGFYRLVGDDLVLGPFQGPIACTRIKRGRGVCGAARERRETVVVPDVEQFPGHIACSSASRSEIVVPVFDSEGNVKAVLDIDSEHLATFDDVDARFLEQIAALFRN